MKINNLAELQQQKQLLNAQAMALVETMKGDVDHIKKSLSPLAILARVLPESVLIDKLVRGPIHFLERKLEERQAEKAVHDPAAAKKDAFRGIALNIIEKAASAILSRYAGTRR